MVSGLNSGDILVLNNNITQDGADEITIAKSLTIKGNGHTIDAQGKSSIFTVNSNGVVLENITFINGKTTESGSAVHFNGGGSIVNSTFINCSTTIYNLYMGGCCLL